MKKIMLRIPRGFWAQSIISFFIIFCTGIYVNLITTIINADPTRNITQLIGEMKIWNILPVIGFIALLLQTYIQLNPRLLYIDSTKRLIESVLEPACRSLSISRKNRTIRVIVTMINKDKKTRTTRFTYNMRPDPERTGTYPIDFGVCGIAILNGNAVMNELPPNHMSTYPPEVRPFILPELKWVLAAPIFLPEKSDAGPIGVLAFDGTEPWSTVELDSRQAKDIVQAWADVIGELLGAAKVMDLSHYTAGKKQNIIKKEE